MLNSKSLKIIIFTLLLALYGSFLVYKISLPVAQDLPRQIQNGKDILGGDYDVFTKNVYSYTEPNQHFANHHWLYGVLAYVLYLTVGFSGMVIFKIILLLGMFALLFYLTQKNKSFYLTALLSIPTIFILINRTAFRPEIFSFLFLVLSLYLLLHLQKNPNSKRVFWLIPIQLIWVNTHLFFGVGIMMVLGFLVQNIILNREKIFKNQITKKLSIIFVSLIAVSFINPFGLWGVVFSLMVNTSATFPISSGEITPIINAHNLAPGWDTISATIFFPSILVLFLSFVVAFIYRKKNHISIWGDNYIFYFLASIGSTILPFIIVRGLPLFAIIFLPAVVSNLNGPFVWLKGKLYSRLPNLKNGIRYTFSAVFSILVIYLIFAGQTKLMNFMEQGIGLTRYSEDPIKFFKANNLKGPIFNDTDIGSYLIGTLYPKEKVFTDNRFGDAYSSEFFSDIYLPALRNEDSWKELDKSYNFNTIIFYHYDALDGARDFLYRRIYDPAWAWIYLDNSVVILVKNNIQNKDVIDKYQITGNNILNKVDFLSTSGKTQDLIAAADICNLVGRVDLSLQFYQKVVSLDSTRGKVWMVLGRTELRKADQANSNPYLAAIYLENAIKNGWKTWESYSYLALAYYRTGQIDRAKAMIKEEARIDPNNPDVKKWQEIIVEEDSKLQNGNK